MKKIITTIVIALVTVLFFGSLYYLYTKNKKIRLRFKRNKQAFRPLLKKLFLPAALFPKKKF